MGKNWVNNLQLTKRVFFCKNPYHNQLLSLFPVPCQIDVLLSIMKLTLD